MTQTWKYNPNWVTDVEKACASGLNGVTGPIAEAVASRARAAEKPAYGKAVHVIKQTKLKRKGAGDRHAGHVVVATGDYAARVESKRGTLARALKG